MRKKTKPKVGSFILKTIKVSIKKDGRSYKLYFHRKNIWRCRFNKTNINIFFLKGVKSINNRRYNNYNYIPFWYNKHRLKFSSELTKIRPFNTFTNRGILDKNKIFYKRKGFISGYV